MLETAVGNRLLGASAKRSRHTIVITDGLPNVPRRRPEEVCKVKDYLSKDDLKTDPLAPNPDERFCDDRNFREGVDAAHSVALGQYASVNLHHILYWSAANKSFIDFDDKGTLNPADFLIENSARTGNGKVKFKAAVGPSDLQQALGGLISQFDAASLQRVEITVTDASLTTRPKYSAVSPSGFPAVRFDLKLLYLTTGRNTVRVDYIYGDRTVSETLTVDVLASGSPQGSFSCGAASSSFTVDGDRKDYPVCLRRDPRDVIPEPPGECQGANPRPECECKAPTGDGFLPFPDSEGNIRVYRNTDPVNQEFESQDQFARARDFGAGKGDPKASDLRIQGGLGNCGVVAGLDPQSARSTGWLTLSLLLMPLGLAFIWARRRRSLGRMVQQDLGPTKDEIQL
jgi:hypothetical protein